MIYDLFMYSGEENILEIRLNELKDVVDKFIILESPKSHTKLDKPLFFLEQKERFEQFKDKIEYYSLDYCIHENPFYNDEQGRICLYNFIKDRLTDKDLVLAGDLDEIPRAEILKSEINDYSQPITFFMSNRVLCYDLEQTGLKFPGTSVLRKNAIEGVGLNNLRNNRQNYHRTFFKMIEDGGWHFTFCAGIEKTLNKIKFFAHAPETLTWARTEEEIVKCIKSKTSIDNHTKLHRVDFNNKNLPLYVTNNKNKHIKSLSYFYE